MSTPKTKVTRTPVERYIFETGKKDEEIQKLANLGHPTFVAFKKGFKKENLRKKIRAKYPVDNEKGKGLYFPNRPASEPKEFWENKIKEVFDLDIKVTEIVPVDKDCCNMFFKILTKPRKLKYNPDDDTKKRVAKIFKADWKTIYEDRSEE